MPIPVLKPTAARAETFAGVTYHVEGELVPVLQCARINLVLSAGGIPAP
jgi:hypothetical protein